MHCPRCGKRLLGWTSITKVTLYQEALAVDLAADLATVHIHHECEVPQDKN